MDPTREKNGYKEIRLPLGVIEVCREERLWPTPRKNARHGTEHFRQKRPQIHRLDPQRGRRRVGVLWGCEPTAREVRSEVPQRLHRRRSAPSGCFERRAPRSAPNTAPDPPLPPGAAAPRARGGTRCVARRSSPWAAGRWTRGRKTRTATVSASRLQGNQLREPTSPEKLCSKLGESTEWPGLFNRRFLSWGGSPAGSRCPGAPQTRPLPPDCPFGSRGILSSLGGPAHREYLSWSPLPANPWWRPLHFHPGIAESGAPRHQERLLWRMDPRRTWNQRKRTEAGRARAEPGGTRPLSWGGRWPPKWRGSPRWWRTPPPAHQ